MTARRTPQAEGRNGRGAARTRLASGLRLFVLSVRRAARRGRRDRPAFRLGDADHDVGPDGPSAAGPPRFGRRTTAQCRSGPCRGDRCRPRPPRRPRTVGPCVGRRPRARQRALSGRTVRAVCGSEPASVAPDDDVDRAVQLMRAEAVRRLPVVEDGRPVGIVALGDLTVERDPTSALGDISAAEPSA
ncbi:CBS domain-containing protein [Streptomyces sp. NBC_00670]|uniref:CBS domain-containing protein n=1 Tax=Streptomyces sp. NBC_00670 TaxID=2975804 RepID=UPI003FA70C22